MKQLSEALFAWFLGSKRGEALPLEGQTDLIEAPPFFEWSERAATLMVIVLNITVAISCLPISSSSGNALWQKRTWTPDLPLYACQGIAPVATLGGRRI